MQRDLTTDAHLAALEAFQSFTNDRMVSYHSGNTPDWEQSHAIWC
ncbi:MAG: hypothetical protein AAGG06_13305 [Pseudomonadota bacterium]